MASTSSLYGLRRDGGLCHGLATADAGGFVKVWRLSTFLSEPVNRELELLDAMANMDRRAGDDDDDDGGGGGGGIDEMPVHAA